jgi:hypothetical protein
MKEPAVLDVSGCVGFLEARMLGPRCDPWTQWKHGARLGGRKADGADEHQSNKCEYGGDKRQNGKQAKRWLWDWHNF